MTASSCPPVEQLKALLDGTLAEDVQLKVQAHADACATCQKALEALTVGSESWIGVVDELQQQTPPPETKLAEAMQKIKEEEPEEFAREAAPYRPSAFDLVQEFLTPTAHPGAIGRLGNYEVTEVIGHGGFGAVFKAFDPALHRVVAVKVLASHLAHHAVARRRFIREAQAAAAVCHENVVTIHAIEEAAGNGAIDGAGASQPKIVMQYVSGGSLQERLDHEGPLELKEILRIGMQTAAGLAAAHAQGLVHRDVKPGNILLENGVQRVKLTDFGLARVVDDASLTMSGVIAGTPQYMSPEQAWGRSVDHRSDLFSLGAVLYAMCVGHSPFRARSTMAVLKRVCDEQPRPIQAINPDMPEWLCEIINRLLSKSPDARFQTAEEVSELLGGYLAHVQQPTINPAPSGWRNDVAIVTAELSPSESLEAQPVVAREMPTVAPSHREQSRSSFWKWVVVILLLMPLGLLLSMSVLWFSYRAASRSEHEAAMKEQMAAEQAVLALRERAAIAEMNSAVTDASPDAVPRVDPQALNALKGRWVVVSAEGTIPSSLAEPRSAESGSPPGMMPGGSIPAGFPGTGAMSGSGAEQVAAPQLIEFTDREVKVTTSRDTTFMLTILGPSNFVLHRVTALDGAQSLSGTYLIDDDRLVLNWGPFDVPPKSLTRSERHQLVVCRREFVTAATEVIPVAVESDLQAISVEIKNAGETLRVTGDPQNLPRADVPFTDREATALQAAWAKKLNVEVEITNSIGMRLRLIPPGKSQEAKVSETTTIVDPFSGLPVGAESSTQTATKDGVVAPIYVGVHEVTRKQFQQFVTETNYVTAYERLRADAGGNAGAPSGTLPTWKQPRCQQADDSHPVVEIFVTDALAFTRWLSRKEKKTYRLLRDLELEFAARAGRSQPLALGTEKLKYRSQFFASTAPVGSYPANEFGLRDLIGNAAELTFRQRAPQGLMSPLAMRASTPLLSPTDINNWVVCGGDYATSIEASQPSVRVGGANNDSFAQMAVGFRVAIDLTASTVLPQSTAFVSMGDALVDMEATAQMCELSLRPKEKGDAESQRKLVVIVRDVIALDFAPYAFEWVGIEIERGVSDIPTNLRNTDIAEWQPLDVESMKAMLAQCATEADSVPARFTNRVLTAPLIAAKPSLRPSASHALIDERSNPELSTGGDEAPVMFVRFYDFSAPLGKHCFYRYRLKYRLPGIESQTEQLTGWRTSVAVSTQ